MDSPVILMNMAGVMNLYDLSYQNLDVIQIQQESEKSVD